MFIKLRPFLFSCGLLFVCFFAVSCTFLECFKHLGVGHVMSLCNAITKDSLRNDSVSKVMLLKGTIGEILRFVMYKGIMSLFCSCS